jgi:hypothetical protein
MNGDITFLLVLFIIVVLFIVINARRSSNKYLRKAKDLEEEGKYLDALSLYSRHSLEEAARLVLRTPEASQILALRVLEKKFHKQKIEKTFIQLARSNLMRNEHHSAANAFVLAKKPFAAAKVFVDVGGLEYVPTAIQILDKNISLIHDRNQAIRNLAKHAYNNQKFMESAELLRTIGADEEANTVLIAAATEMRQKGLDQAAEEYLTSAGRPGVALQHYLKEIDILLKRGEIEKLRRVLAIARNIIEGLPAKEKEAITKELRPQLIEMDEWGRQLKILDSARDILRKKNTHQAIALYDELLESLGKKTPALILAEAALANETENPQYASKLYFQAAKQVESPRAAESFKIRANRLMVRANDQISPTIGSTVEIIEDVEEFCSVCRMKITLSSNLVRCPECGSPAHYSHLAEWLKIRGVCPICKKRVKVVRPAM